MRRFASRFTRLARAGALAATILCGGRTIAAPGDTLLTIVNPEPAVNDFFGSAVCSAGGNIVVGAYNDDSGGKFDSGTVYIFDATTGAQLKKIVNPTPADDDQFGYSVAGTATRLYVGANFDDTAGEDAGAVYVFDADPSSGTFGDLIQTITDPAAVAGEQFGFSVAAYFDNDLIVGAPAAMVGGQSAAGKALLVTAESGSVRFTYLNPEPGVGANFGYSVSALSNNVMIGAPNAYVDFKNGAVYTFDTIKGNQVDVVRNPLTNGRESYGWSVADIGGDILAGAPAGLLDSGLTPGTGYLVNPNDGSILRNVTNPNPSAGDEFALSVAPVNGGYAVGAPYDDFGGSDSGVAYLFDAASGGQIALFINPAADRAGDGFGYAVAGLGSNVIVGAIYESTGAAGAGAVYLMEGSAPTPTASPSPTDTPETPSPTPTPEVTDSPSPTPFDGRSVGDFDNSGCTDLSDFLFLLDYWQIVSPIGGDAIGLTDFLALLDFWQTGSTCP